MFLGGLQFKQALLSGGGGGGRLEASVAWMDGKGWGEEESGRKRFFVSVTLPLYSTLYPLQISNVWAAPSPSASSVWP